MPESHTPKILFISMPGTVHTGRWIDQLNETGWDIHLFSPFRTCDLTIHESLPAAVTMHLIVKQKRFKVRQTGLAFPFTKGDRFRLAATRIFETFVSRPERLANLIGRIKPDIVHSLQMQGSSYLTLEAKRILEKRGMKFPKWIYSSWGSDIYLFGPQPEHGEKIRDVLHEVDYLISDCQRDINLAREYGFSGEILGIVPTGGGFEVEDLQQYSGELTSSRRTIAIKGIMRSEQVGRATVALDAIAECANELAGHEIVMYSADGEAREKAKRINEDGIVNINFFPPSSHGEFVKLLGQTKLSIGLNISDGTPNTMLESMMMGAFPIQSDTVSTREWIKHGKNGFLVDPNDPIGLATTIRHALGDKELLNEAAIFNKSFIREKLSRDNVQGDVIDMYQQVLSDEIS